MKKPRLPIVLYVMSVVLAIVAAYAYYRGVNGLAGLVAFAALVFAANGRAEQREARERARLSSPPMTTVEGARNRD